MNDQEDQKATDDRKLPQELVEKVKTRPELKGLPAATIEKVLSALPLEQDQEFLYREQSSFVGPVPPPEFLSRYNEINPTFADRIMLLAENEQEIKRDEVVRNQEIKEREIETNYKIRENEIEAKSKETDLVVNSINLYTRSSSIISILLVLCPFTLAGISIFLGRSPATGMFMGGLGVLPLAYKILQMLIEKDRNGNSLNGD